MSCARTITLAFISLELFPFDYFSYNFVSALQLQNLKRYFNETWYIIKHDEMLCHAKEP